MIYLVVLVFLLFLLRNLEKSEILITFATEQQKVIVMCALQKQYDFFKRNMSSLLEDYNGKYLVIPESLEVKAFDTISEAYIYGAKTYGLGKFLLQECNDNADKVQIISNLGLGLA